MKSSFLLAAVLACSISASAQTDYMPVLQNTFIAFDTAYNDMQAKVNAGNKLILIAKKYPAAWETNYYAAYSRVQLSYFEKDEAKRDAYVDEADNYFAEALHVIGRHNDETHVMAAMIANARLGVKPQTRWQKYGKIFDEHLDSAKVMNPENPRIYLQKGISKFYTPKMFGGGKKAAAPYFEKAQILFAKESGSDMSKPYWGKGTNAYFLEQIKGDD